MIYMVWLIFCNLNVIFLLHISLHLKTFTINQNWVLITLRYDKLFQNCSFLMDELFNTIKSYSKKPCLLPKVYSCFCGTGDQMDSTYTDLSKVFSIPCNKKTIKNQYLWQLAEMDSHILVKICRVPQRSHIEPVLFVLFFNVSATYFRYFNVLLFRLN